MQLLHWVLIPYQVKIHADLYRHIPNDLSFKMNKICSMIAGGKLVYNNLAHWKINYFCALFKAFVLNCCFSCCLGYFPSLVHILLTMISDCQTKGSHLFGQIECSIFQVGIHYKGFVSPNFVIYRIQMSITVGLRGNYCCA